MVPIEVVETAIHHRGVNREVLPHLDCHCQQHLACLPIQLGKDLIVEVAGNELFEAGKDLLVVVLVVTVVYNQLVNLCELAMAGDDPDIAPQEGPEFTFVIFADDRVNVVDWDLFYIFV